MVGHPTDLQGFLPTATILPKLRTEPPSRFGSRKDYRRCHRNCTFSPLPPRRWDSFIPSPVPDHYLPFIVMAKARNWSDGAKPRGLRWPAGWGTYRKFGCARPDRSGVRYGGDRSWKDSKSFRENLAAWALIWRSVWADMPVRGIRRAVKNRPHEHVHFHKDAKPSRTHAFTHATNTPMCTSRQSGSISLPGSFSPFSSSARCEPLIPILMYPAAQHSTFGLIMVTAVFGVVTISTMLGIVLVSSFGISFLPMRKLERYSHALAGGTLSSCGVAIQFLGL